MTRCCAKILETSRPCVSASSDLRYAWLLASFLAQEAMIRSSPSACGEARCGRSTTTVRVSPPPLSRTSFLRGAGVE